MTLQEVLDRVNDIIDNHNHHELNLLRNDLEDDIIWKNISGGRMIMKEIGYTGLVKEQATSVGTQ